MVFYFVTRGDALASLALAPGYHIPRLWRSSLPNERFALPEDVHLIHI